MPLGYGPELNIKVMISKTHTSRSVLIKYDKRTYCFFEERKCEIITKRKKMRARKKVGCVASLTTLSTIYGMGVHSRGKV